MAETVSAEDRQQGMLAHLLNGIFPLVGGLIIWLIGKDKSKFVDTEGKEATNFGITAVVIIVGLNIIGFITAFVGIGFLIFGLAWIAWVGVLIWGIIASQKANKGENYRYGLNFRFIK